MDVMRRNRQALIRDQENIHAQKGKANVFPSKKPGLSARGALGDLSTNVQTHRDMCVGKVAVAAAEFEIKAALNRGAAKSNYNHVQSKIDTGLSGKIQPSRPPLRREESTAGLAVKAVAAHTKVNLKSSEPVNISIPAKKTETKRTEARKPSKLTSVKEHKELKIAAAKPVLKDSAESFGKLKITENSSHVNHTKKNESSLLVPVVDSVPELPADIEDIDAVDSNSPFLMTVYIKDIYKYLTELEKKYPIHSDYLQKQSVVTGRMRATLVDWLVELQHQFSLTQETFQLAVGIIDRYLQAVTDVPRHKLQLVGVSAMFLASKYEEVYAPDAADFVYVTDNSYDKSELLRQERHIMAALGFCLARPVPLSFLRRFVKAARGTAKNHHLAKYLIDLSLVESSMAHYHPSELAAAAICLSLYLLSTKSFTELWTPTLSYYSGYTLQHLEPIIKKIAKIVANVKNSKTKAVYTKYQDASLAKVSTLPQLKNDYLRQLLEDLDSCEES